MAPDESWLPTEVLRLKFDICSSQLATGFKAKGITFSVQQTIRKEFDKLSAKNKKKVTSGRTTANI